MLKNVCSHEIEDIIMQNVVNHESSILLVEPFYGGSHRQLIDTLKKYFPNNELVTLSAKKWHWRARCSALTLADLIPRDIKQNVLFCSSVLSLAELLGLRPDLCSLKKIVYFHENQLVYPKQTIKERDVQYAYNQITTCLAADVVVFNSHYNKISFLQNIAKIVKMLPDYKPKGLPAKIEPKCQVIYFPVEFPILKEMDEKNNDDILHIVWPHRWEFDKDPLAFVNVLVKLQADGFDFKVSIIGQTFDEVPEIFKNAYQLLGNKIVNYGFVESRDEYYKILQLCHVAVSTAQHEFFGVSMLEASFCGCLPLVPNRLVYPEIYPDMCIYEDDDGLYTKLKEYCKNPDACKRDQKAMKLDFHKFSISKLLPIYLNLFN